MWMMHRPMNSVFVILLLLSVSIRCQYPTATLEWDFMPTTGMDNIDLIAGATLDKGGANGAIGQGAWREPNFVDMGWIFEGDEIACGGPAADYNVGDTFGTHVWIYFTDIEKDQVIWCKEWLEAPGDPLTMSLRLCLALISGQFTIIWNPADALTHKTVATLPETYNYMFQKLDMFAKYGWIYLAVNFKTDPITQIASVWGYMADHDQCKIVSNIYELPGAIVDDDKFVWCLGASAQNHDTGALEITRPLMAIINQWYILSGAVIERWNAMDAFGLQCSDYCQICRKSDQPKCLEDLETSHLHYWDFAPFRWYRPVWDYGQERAVIGLGIVMLGQGLYTHQGMWFDGGRTLVPVPSQWEKYSFTVDAWFKFYNNVGGTIMESVSPSTRQWDLTFRAVNNVDWTVNGETLTTPFTFSAATDFNKWMIVQATSAKHTLLTNKLCVKMNEDPIVCQITTNTDVFYDDVTPAQPATLIIGAGFGGFIRKIKVYDWPKMEPSMELMYKLSPQCYQFHHNQSDCHICDIDYNFTCYSDCSERKQWDYDCKTCEASCYTCSGNDAFHCFSCYETLYRFHERCTCCPETCGDGRFMDDSYYDCDDGNNAADDGCDPNCLFEAGFACIDGTPATATVCTEICGDGRKINHACDDGNTDYGDGCAGDCTMVETGYQCTGGGRNIVDVCWEICGDGLDYGDYPCDDGNTNAGDGCDPQCVIETGWTCGSGTILSPDVCTETCGDGFRTNAACDDGNLVDGDGCSSTCTVENGWMCGHEQPSICWKISVPSIIDTFIGDTLFSFTFNESVILDAGYTSSDYDISLSGPMTPYSLTWDFISAPYLMVPFANYTIWFSYSTSDQLFGNGSESLTVNFTDMTRIKNAAYNFEMINSSVTFNNLFPQETTKACGDLLFNIVNLLIFCFILIIGVLSAMLGHSYAIVWMAMNIMQFTHFAPVMHIFVPSCVSNFGTRFNVFNCQYGNFFKEFTERYIFQRHDFYSVIDYKFIRAGYDTGAFLYNAVDLITIWFAVGVVLLINIILRKASKNNRGIEQWEQECRKHLLFIMVMYTYLRTCFLCALNFRYAQFMNHWSNFSFCLALAGAAMVVAFPVYEGWNAVVFYRELKAGKKPTYMRLNVLYNDFSLSHPLKYFYYWQYFVRRFVFAVLLVGFPQSKYVALCTTTIMHIFSMLYVTYTMPFSSKWRNIAVMVSEATLVASYGSLFAFLQDTPGTGRSHYTGKAFFYFLIITVGMIILAVLIVIDSFAHLKKIKTLCKEPEEETGPRRIIDSFSSNSNDSDMTQREVSLESDDQSTVRLEIYDPKTENEKIVLDKKQNNVAQNRKTGKKRPDTPPKKGEPLVSKYGRPQFKDIQQVEDDPLNNESEDEKEATQTNVGTPLKTPLGTSIR